MTKTIEYKNSTFYCDTCNRLVSRAKGYFIPSLMKVYCYKHYEEAVAELFKEGKTK